MKLPYMLLHAWKNRVRSVAKRFLFALDMDTVIDRTCHTCTALQQSPTVRIEQSTSPPPDVVGQSFAADVIKRSQQLMLVLRKSACNLIHNYVAPQR